MIVEEVSDFKNHMEDIHSGDNYKKSAKLKLHPCNFCHVCFERLADFKYHDENNHVDDALTKRDSNNQQNKEIDKVARVIENLCTVCLLSFKADTELKQHISKHSEAKKISSILKNY